MTEPEISTLAFITNYWIESNLREQKFILITVLNHYVGEIRRVRECGVRISCICGSESR